MTREEQFEAGQASAIPRIRELEAKNAELEKKLKIAMEALEYADGWWYNPHLYDETIAEEKMNETLAAIKDS